MKFQLGAIAERLESQDLQLLKFEQSNSFVRTRTRWIRLLGLRWLECAANRETRMSTPYC
jgi:hypothetical protein